MRLAANTRTPRSLFSFLVCLLYDLRLLSGNFWRGKDSAQQPEWQILEGNTEEIIVRHDRRGRIRFPSPSLARLTGYRSMQLLGQRGVDLVHEDDAPALRAAAHAAFTEEHGASTMFRIRTSTGGYIWLDARLRVSPAGRQERELTCTVRPIALTKGCAR